MLHYPTVSRRPIVPRQDVLTLREWAVTGSLMVYGEKKERWSAAHFVDLALWVGGPDAGIQAARALNVFGVWNPFGDYNPHFDRKSIRVCQDHRTILGRIWPEENDGSRLLAWANHYSCTTEQPFNKSGGEGNEIDDSNDADEAVHAEENVAEDEPEDVAEDRADEVEDAAQTPLEGPVDEQNFVPRRQPRNPQDLNIGRLTRGVARTSELITNDLYQQSLDISPDVIAEFINTRNPRCSHNWREVLGHRTANGMMVAGREDRPPYPSKNPLVDSPRTHHTRQNAQANLYSEYLSNIQSDVDRLKNLAQSQQGYKLFNARA
ncbi:hypothetical protein KCU78_g10073, partial [Aureobasidium melanogenum]